MIVLIPSYEPDVRLVQLLQALTAADAGLRLVVVDDGSGPAYARYFDAARAHGATVLIHPINQGKGRALKTGFAHALAHYPGEEVVCADSDGQHSVPDILRVAEHVRAGADFVLGARRFAGDVPARSRFGNTITRAAFRLATGRDLLDTQTGLRGYAPDVLAWLLAVPGERFEYELNALLRAARQGRPIAEVEIETIYLEHNASSHFRPVIDSARIYVPLLGFLGSSVAAFAIDVVALFVLHAVLGVLLLSVVGARLISASVNFRVNRRMVFGAAGTQPPRAAALRYAALAGGLLLANYVLLRSLTSAGLGLLNAKVVTEVLLVGVSYTVQRLLVFRTDSTPVGSALPAQRSAR